MLLLNSTSSILNLTPSSLKSHCLCVGVFHLRVTVFLQIWALQLEIVRTDNSEALPSLFSAQCTRSLSVWSWEVVLPLLPVCTLLSLCFWSGIPYPRQTKLMLLLSGTSKAPPGLYLPPSCALQAWRKELCSSPGSISPGVLACRKQPVFGRAPCDALGF